MSLDRILTAALFFGLCYGLGLGALRLAPRRTPADLALLAPLVGLGCLPPLLFVLRLLHVPLRWWIVAGLAALAAAAPFRFRRAARGIDESAPRTVPFGWIAALAAVALAALLFTGATRYPWLEDDDPWQHAVGAHYVAKVATVVQPATPVSQYLEPYPPYFTALMGLLHQVQPDLQWTLKFFNALIAGLSLLAAFFAFERLSSDPRKAAAAVVILGILPAWMSHFIWSQTLAIPVFFAAIWACASLAERPARVTDPTMWLAILLVWSATIIQPSTAAVFALLLAIFAVVTVETRRREGRPFPSGVVAAIAGGGALAAVTWGFAIATYGWTHFAESIRMWPTLFAGRHNEDKSGGAVYGLGEFLFPTSSGKIDQAAGLGWLVCALALAGALLPAWKRGRRVSAADGGLALMLAWLLVGLLGVEGNALPVKLFPHRFWVFLAIPVAFLAADAIVSAAEFNRLRGGRAAVMVGLVGLVVLTCWAPRVGLQHAMWMPGVDWNDQEEVAAYVRLKELPPQTRAFSLCGEQAHLIGMNVDSEPWSEGLRGLQAGLAEGGLVDVVGFMQRERYEYVVLDRRCSALGPARLMEMQRAVLGSGAFDVFYEGPGVIVLRLRTAG